MSSVNPPATPSLEEIASAIKLIDVKKDELKKAFDDLQANSLHLSSFTISWPDLNSHFTAIQNSVTRRFRLLESRESSHCPDGAVPVLELTRCPTYTSTLKQDDPSSSKPLTTLGSADYLTDSNASRPLTTPGSVDYLTDSNASRPLNCDLPSVGLQIDGSAPVAGRIDSVVIRPELKGFCERMDAKGLRKYINDHVKERDAIQMELPGALKSAPNPGAMVLDAMEGFYEECAPYKGDKNKYLFSLRKVCLSLLKQLMETGFSFSEEVRERAKKLALEWKGKARLRSNNTLEPLALLLLVATYSLEGVLDKDELVEYFFITAGCPQARMLSGSIDLGEKVHDLIQKLVDNGKHTIAVRFIFEFGLAEKFPPVPLLDNYLKETKKLAEQVCIDGKNSYKSLTVATAKEVGALKSVIKVIQEFKLETEYPQECLQKRIEQLEKQQADRKRSGVPPAAKPQLQQANQQAKKKNKKPVMEKQQQNGNKRPKTTASVIPTVPSFGVASSSSAVLPFQQSHLQPAGLFPDQSAANLSSLTCPYGLAGPTPGVNPFLSSLAALYGLARAPPGFSVTPNPVASHFYSHDNQPTNGQYGLPPQYRPQ